MSARTILTLANGKGIDLLNPRPEDVDWDAYAEHLAKENRYNGATPGIEYSVAEHLSRGMDAALAAGESPQTVAYFGLHDAPEGVLKDDTTPKKHAIAELIERRCGILSADILKVLGELTEIHDIAIHAAAGLPWPMPAAVQVRVKHWDLVMFVTEWRDVMRDAPHPNWAPYQQLQPLTERISPMDWNTAKRALLRRWRQYLPALVGSNVVRLPREVNEVPFS